MTDVTAQETAYRTQIKGLEDKIRKIKGTKQIGELLGDRVKEWEEEKAQVEVNLKDFRENKAKLEKRVAALKANKAQVDSTLQRINNIGKTPTELRAEREAKVAEERRQREQKTTAQQTQGQPLAKKRAGGEEAGEAAAGVSEVVDDGGDSDDWADTGEKFRQAVRPGGDLSNYRESARGKRPRPVAPVAERRVPRREQTEGRGAEGGEIVRPTRYWLNVLFDGRIENPRAKRIMEKHFRLGDVLKMSDDMTPAQVIDAYAGYLVEFEGLKLKYALLETKKKVTGIVEHIDEYDSGQRELDAADFRLSQPTAGSAQASEGVVKAPPAGREQAKAVAQPEGQGGPAAGGEEGMVELEQALNKSGQGEGKPADKPAGTATEVGGTSKAESGGKPSTNSVIEAFGRAGATAVQGKTEGGDGEQVKKK